MLNVSLFAPMKRNLTPILRRSRLELADGMKVRIFGQLDFYAPTGRLGLKMAGIDPRFTLGELSQARDQVVRAARRQPACSTPTAPRRCRRSRCVSASSPASARRRGTTSATSSIAAGSGSDLAVCDTRGAGRVGGADGGGGDSHA